MAIRDTLKALLDGVSSAPHNYQPSTYSFAELDADKMKAVLKPEKRGNERGKRNEPPEASEAPDEVETEIVKSVE